MMNRQIGTAAFLCLLTVIGIGCDFQKDTLTSSLNEKAVSPVESGFPATNKFFTGRDSFGVALKVRVTGQAEFSTDSRCSDQTVQLSGSGTATHLGAIEATLTHCTDESDPSSVVNGEFVFSSSIGRIVGEYEPLPVVRKHDRSNGDVIEVKAEITDGAVTAVKHDELEGMGDLHITIGRDSLFKLTLDGWLLHHVAED